MACVDTVDITYSWVEGTEICTKTIIATTDGITADPVDELVDATECCSEGETLQNETLLMACP